MTRWDDAHEPSRRHPDLLEELLDAAERDREEAMERVAELEKELDDTLDALEITRWWMQMWEAKARRAGAVPDRLPRWLREAAKRRPDQVIDRTVRPKNRRVRVVAWCFGGLIAFAAGWIMWSYIAGTGIIP